MRVEQENRKLSPQAFHRLRFDQCEDSEPRSYLEMRRRLVNYFDRKNVATPEVLAEETLNRVALRLGEEEIADCKGLARDCCIVARLVLMKHLRLNKGSEGLRPDMKSTVDATMCSNSEQLDTDEKERMLYYVEECMERLDRASREIITQYYVGEESEKIENRSALAKRLGVTPNALSIRACRIRNQLESCVRDRRGG